MENNSSEANENAYKYIGLFSVNFQKIIFQLEQLIRFAFRASGLKDMTLIDIFIAGQRASTTIVQAKTFLYKCYSLDNDEKSICDEVFESIKKLNFYRNDILHGTLLVGFSHEGQLDFDTIPYVNKRQSKKGVKYEFEYKEIEEIKDNAERAYKFASQVNQMNMYFFQKSQEHPVPISLEEYINNKCSL